MIRFFFLFLFASVAVVSGSVPHANVSLSNVTTNLPRKLAPVGAVVSGSVPHAKVSLSNVTTKLPRKLAPVGAIISSVIPWKARLKAKEFLTAHNDVRVKLGLPPLTWDNGLARYARRFANTRVADCKMVHSNGMYGENIFWGRSDLWSPEKIVGVWVEEENYYDPSTNSCMPGEICGHYTQVVWRDTLRCGCARVNCTGLAGVYAICVYDPPGNYVGESPFQHYTEE